MFLSLIGGGKRSNDAREICAIMMATLTESTTRENVTILFSPSEGFLAELRGNRSLSGLAEFALYMNSRGADFHVVDRKNCIVDDPLKAVAAGRKIRSTVFPEEIKCTSLSEDAGIDSENPKHTIRTRTLRMNEYLVIIKDVSSCSDPNCGYQHGPWVEIKRSSQ